MKKALLISVIVIAVLVAMLFASSIFQVYQGGTGTNSLTAHGVLLGEGTSAIAATATGSSGQVLTSNGSIADPTFQALSTGCALSNGVNAQTASYTLLSGDAGKLVTFNGSSLTATLPSSPPSSTWCARMENLNATGLAISRNGLTINGGTSNLSLAQYQTVTCVTDNSNYFCTRPIVAGSNVTITESANQESIASSGGGGGGGTETLVCSGSVSNAAELDFSSSSNCGGSNPFGGSYHEWRLFVQSSVVATNNKDTVIQFCISTCSSWDTTAGDYKWVGFGYSAVGTGIGSCTNTTCTSDEILFASCASANAANYTASFDGYFTNPTDTSNYKLLHGLGGGYDCSNNIITQRVYANQFLTTSALSGIRILAASGNITVSAYLYGIN